MTEPAPVEGALPLSAAGSVHMVSAGEAMLFAVSAAGNAMRRPLAPVATGGLLFGIEPDMLSDEHLVAIPSEPFSLFPLPDTLLQAPLPDPIVAGVGGWIAALSRGIGDRVEPRPRADLLLSAAGRAAVLPAGGVIACQADPLWVQLPDGGADLCGLETVEGRVPLAPGAWLVLANGGVVTALPWADGFDDDGWRGAVDLYSAAVQAILPIARGFADADELNRVRAQDVAEERDSARIAQRLSLAVGTGRIAAPAVAEGLLDVVRLVADEEGLTVRRPTPAGRAQQDVLPTLDEIARASGFRTQPVRLEGDWWREDGGAMVATLLDGRSAALLRRGRGYRLIDDRGDAVAVDAAVAATVGPQAHTLMPRYPAGDLGLAELMKLSGRGGAADNWSFAGAIVAGSLLGQALPRATGYVFGQLVPSSLTGAIVQVAALVLLTGGVALLFQIALGASRQRVEARSTARAYAAVWDRVLSLPLSYLARRGPAEVAVHVQSVLSTETGFRGLGVLVAASGGMLVSAMALILSRQASLGLLVLGFVMVQLALACLAGWLQSRSEKSEEQLEGDADGMLFQMIGGVSKLRTAAAERRAILRWTDRFVAMRRRRVGTQRVSNLYESWLAGFAVIGAAGLFAMLAASTDPLAKGGGLAVAEVLMVLSAFTVTLTAVAQLVRGLLGLWLLKPSWKYARRLLEEVPEQLADRIDPGPLTGAIDVSNVAFRYGPDTPPVLAGVTFSIQPGQFVAVVGSSGSGKSTLIRMILGLAPPLAGAVYIDGHDVRSLHPEALRRQIGVVLQDMPLPAGSILEVVRGFHTQADEAAVWAALEAAAIAQDVAAMPMGLHTLVTDGGGTISGGQRQRLALARVLLHRPAILLLDEATSALDAQTQAQAMASVIALPATRMVIAHRMSTVREADLILVLSGGRIVQAGRYDELAAEPGAFAELIDEKV